MLIVEDPGHWLQFINRPDNRGLNQELQKQKYLKEQYLFKEYMSYKIQQELARQGQEGGASKTIQPELNPLPSNCIEFVINTYFGTTYYFDMVSSGPCDYSINWGDNNIETGTVDGTSSLSHNYADGGSYTVRLCFSDASLITEMDFIGDD